MSTPPRWAPSFDPTDRSRPRVFCFPAAGGNTAAFYRWRTAMADQLQVVPVELPGHRNRLDVPPHLSFGPLLDELVPVIREAAEVRFAFLGTSMGALLAFETARRLGEHAVDPAHLVVAACPSPRTPRTGTVHRLPDREFLQELHRLGHTPPEVLDSPDLIGLLLPAWRADFTLVETYTYRVGPRLVLPVTAVVARDDPHASIAEVQRWRLETEGPFDLVEVDGGHFFFLDSASPVLSSLIGQTLLTGVKGGDAAA